MPLFHNKQQMNDYKLKIQILEQDLRRVSEANTNLRKERKDSIYQNNLTGMGTFKDVGEHTRVKPFKIYTFNELELLEATEPLICKILSTLTQSVYKNDFVITCDDKDYFKEFKKQWDLLNLDERMFDATDAGYCYGHSFLFLDVNDGKKLSEPLDIKKVRGINNISNINRYFLAADPWERDFQFDPVYYYLVQTPMNQYDHNNESSLKMFEMELSRLKKEKIHHSRLLPFWGKKLKPFLFRQNMHFHDTYIRKVEEAVKAYNTSMDNISTLLSKIPFPIAKISNLYDRAMDDAQSGIFKQQMADRNQMRSTNNLSVMNIDEDFSYYTPTFTGIAEMIDKAEKRLCMMCDIPHDVLLGEGSSGQTTGRTEKTNFERFIQAEQKFKVKPKIIFFMKLFEQLHGLKMPEYYEINFAHSETLTELEESQAFLNNANGTMIFAEQGYDCSIFVEDKYPQITVDKTFEEMNQENDNYDKKETDIKTDK